MRVSRQGGIDTDTVETQPGWMMIAFACIHEILVPRTGI